MREYQLLDTAAQSIDILKALNTRDRDMIQIEAKRKRKEEEPAVLKAMKFRVSPEDMEKTRNDMREIRERGSQISCVKDCMPEILYCFDMKWSSEPAFVPELRAMELIMNKVRAAAMKLQAENPDGHWATELLNFYSDDWMVWLDEINENYVEKWSSDIFHEKWEGAKQRIKVVEEILEEVEKERRQKSYGYGLNGCGRGG